VSPALIAVLPQLLNAVPGLLNAGAEVYLRVAEARLKKQRADMTWDEFVSAVRNIPIGDVDALIAEGVARMLGQDPEA
jgi:hypothetical protein